LFAKAQLVDRWYFILVAAAEDEGVKISLQKKYPGRTRGIVT
jgi:hypothetical protein